MKRIRFDSKGRILDIDSRLNSFENQKDDEDENEKIEDELITSSSLKWLNQNDSNKDETIEDGIWSLYSDGKKLEPLKFSNGKTQEDIVKEVLDLITRGKKVICIHGVCGTGKSAIALNIAKNIGKASVVVPIKSLQKQYEEDYMSKKYVLKKSGEKMKIAMITGRENHDSIIKPGVSCADPLLPDNIQFATKNYQLLREYYLDNPIIKHKSNEIDIKRLKRIAIAPANPHWSPIVNSLYELPLRDADKKRYMGLNGKEFTFYHRKRGCSYYDQYQSYIDADVIIFNSAKYKIEVALDRKPETDIDIIDEADEFLDNFSSQEEINLTRLSNSIKGIQIDNLDVLTTLDQINNLILLELKNKLALGVNENQIFSLKDTQLEKIIKLFTKSPEIEAEISIDELNYTNKALDSAKEFRPFLEDTYVTFRKNENDIYACLVTTNLSKRFREIIDKTNCLILMSGTLHSKDVMKRVFGIEDYALVEAETMSQGTIEIHKTGKELDCRYSNFSSKKNSREDYLIALSECISKAKKPFLVHVNAFDDLPSEDELIRNNLTKMMTKEKLRNLQINDKTGRAISLFKSKLSDSLFTTKCSRGIDFPGDMCNSIIFTKYPNPNVRDTFWKILQKTHPTDYWVFYKDKARREFLQRIYRALRSKHDHVYVLSPDSRVLDAVKELQVQNKN